MYLSYLMGADSITNDELERLNIDIVKTSDEGTRSLYIPDESIEKYKDLIIKKLDPGFWNEFLDKDEIIFIFKHKDGRVEEFLFGQDNQEEIAKLCSEFNGDPIEKTSDILGYLKGNDFYTEFIERHY